MLGKIFPRLRVAKWETDLGFSCSAWLSECPSETLLLFYPSNRDQDSGQEGTEFLGVVRIRMTLLRLGSPKELLRELSP